jgi:hypothetical protein
MINKFGFPGLIILNLLFINLSCRCWCSSSCVWFPSVGEVVVHGEEEERGKVGENAEDGGLRDGLLEHVVAELVVHQLRVRHRNHQVAHHHPVHVHHPDRHYHEVHLHKIHITQKTYKSILVFNLHHLEIRFLLSNL